MFLRSILYNIFVVLLYVYALFHSVLDQKKNYLFLLYIYLLPLLVACYFYNKHMLQYLINIEYEKLPVQYICNTIKMQLEV